MAQRFGGKFSPGGSGSDAAREMKREERTIAKAGWRANLLYVPAAIVLFSSIFGGALTLVLGLVSAALMTVGAFMTREGMRAEAAYNARAVANRPALPRKIIGSLLIGGGVLFGALSGASGPLAALLYGLVASALHVVSFGIDPMRSKGIEGIDAFQQGRVAKVVDEAEDYLKEIRDRIATTDASALKARVDDFVAVARRMIRTVQEDPRDLTQARKYLGVYLLGARDATRKFVELWNQRKDTEARAEYENLLDDMEKNFAARTERMLLDDKSDMEIEVKVLRDRLAREGLLKDS